MPQSLSSGIAAAFRGKRTTREGPKARRNRNTISGSSIRIGKAWRPSQVAIASRKVGKSGTRQRTSTVSRLGALRSSQETEARRNSSSLGSISEATGRATAGASCPSQGEATTDATSSTASVSAIRKATLRALGAGWGTIREKDGDPGALPVYSAF